MAECAQLSQFDEELYKVTGAHARTLLGDSALSWLLVDKGSHPFSSIQRLRAAQLSQRAVSSTREHRQEHFMAPLVLLHPPPPRRGRGQVPDCHQ